MDTKKNIEINNVDKQYNDLVSYIIDEGTWHDATGMYYMDGTMPRVIKVPQVVLRYDLQKELPLITTKEIKPNIFAPISEIIWIQILGSNYVPHLQELGVNIWNQWAKEDLTIGKAYGFQARHVQKHIFDDKGNFLKTIEIDQVKNLVEGIKKNPYSRRHIIDLWNVADLDEMSLVPCCFLTMWDVEGEYLNMTLIQRSYDTGLGGVYNSYQYAVFCHMVAQATGLKPGKMMHVINNAHIYDRHIEPLQEQIKRQPLELATLKVDPTITNIDDFRPEHFKLENYQAHPAIKMPIAIHTHPDKLVIKSKK